MIVMAPQECTHTHTHTHPCRFAFTHKNRVLVSVSLYPHNNGRLFHQELAFGHSSSPFPSHPSIADFKFYASVLNCFSRVNSLRPMDCNLPGSSVHGILQARILSGLPCPSPGDLPDLGMEPLSLMSPELAGLFFTTSTTP